MEKLALEYYCNEDKSVMGVKVYEGNGDVKSLITVCERRMTEGKTFYAYCYEDETGTETVIGNSDAYKAMLGDSFERKQLDKTDCLERFFVNHGDVRIRTVKEAGIRQCLEEWRKGVETFGSDAISLTGCRRKRNVRITWSWVAIPTDNAAICAGL